MFYCWRFCFLFFFYISFFVFSEHVLYELLFLCFSCARACVGSLFCVCGWVVFILCVWVVFILCVWGGLACVRSFLCVCVRESVFFFLFFYYFAWIRFCVNLFRVRVFVVFLWVKSFYCLIHDTASMFANIIFLFCAD